MGTLPEFHIGNGKKTIPQNTGHKISLCWDNILGNTEVIWGKSHTLFAFHNPNLLF